MDPWAQMNQPPYGISKPVLHITSVCMYVMWPKTNTS